MPALVGGHETGAGNGGRCFARNWRMALVANGTSRARELRVLPVKIRESSDRKPVQSLTAEPGLSVAGTRFLLPGESYTLKTVLRPCEGTRLPTTCKLKLRLLSPAGHVYDAVDVIWDNPEPREP